MRSPIPSASRAGRRSGAEVALAGAAVTSWHASRCVRSDAYADRRAALEKLGVTEDALQRVSFGTWETEASRNTLKREG